MTYREATETYIATVTIATILFDVGVTYLSGGRVSISAVMKEIGEKYPIVPAAAGGLLCHWWWQTRGFAE